MMPDYLALYRKHVKRPKRTGSNGEWLGFCPLPACSGKEHPHFYFNETSGLHHCKTCGTGGNAITFAKYFGENYGSYCDRPPKKHTPDPDKVDQFNKALLENKAVWPTPWQEDIIRLLKVGWDSGDKKLVFPVFDETGEIINLIWHKGKQVKGAKVSLYPAHLLSRFDPSYLVVCEGLKDCPSLLSVNIQAITSTGGALAIPKDISALQKVNKVYICQDNDTAGEQGTENWISRLRSEFPNMKLRVCDLSQFVGESGDVTDYLSLQNKNKETFMSDVLERASVGRPFSDVPDFIRQKVLSDEFVALHLCAQLLYQAILFRASRYRVWFKEKSGARQKVQVRPGEYVKRISALEKICPPFSYKQIRTALDELEEAGFIRKENLHNTMGLKITLIGWEDEQGHGLGHGCLEEKGTDNFPFPPSILTVCSTQNGHGNSAGVGHGFGQYK